MTPSAPNRKRVQAILLGDRIDTSGLEHADVLSTAPLAFRAGHDELVAVFRYGVVVLFGLSVMEEDEILRGLRRRVAGPIQPVEYETATLEVVTDKDEQILPGGPIQLKAITPEHMLVIADALAKSVVLARDEREVSSVVEVIEPFARQLAEKGRAPEGRESYSSSSAMRFWSSTASRAGSPSPRSRTRYGSAPIWNGSTRGCKRSTSSRNAPKRSRASSRSSRTRPKYSPI